MSEQAKLDEAAQNAGANRRAEYRKADDEHRAAIEAADAKCKVMLCFMLCCPNLFLIGSQMQGWCRTRRTYSGNVCCCWRKGSTSHKLHIRKAASCWILCCWYRGSCKGLCCWYRCCCERQSGFRNADGWTQNSRRSANSSREGWPQNVNKRTRSLDSKFLWRKFFSRLWKISKVFIFHKKKLRNQKRQLHSSMLLQWLQSHETKKVPKTRSIQLQIKKNATDKGFILLTSNLGIFRESLKWERILSKGNYIRAFFELNRPIDRSFPAISQNRRTSMTQKSKAFVEEPETDQQCVYFSCLFPYSHVSNRENPNRKSFLKIIHRTPRLGNLVQLWLCLQERFTTFGQETRSWRL